MLLQKTGVTMPGNRCPTEWISNWEPWHVSVKRTVLARPA